ncbi:MAG: ParA family protein [Oscillospiraceae bacterium]|nr:ParA family protein [Oscillospiraceae bacterium]
MRTIAILNLKGGVAKTTTVINAAAILAEDYKQRVLLIDADSQCNLTEFFSDGKPYTGDTLADILRGYTWSAQKALYLVGPEMSLTIIPASETLMDLDLTKAESGEVNVKVLKDCLSEVQDDYDYCLIDCPPAFNAASAAALVAADEVIIPIKLDAFSLRGMVNLFRQIKNMRAINPKIKIMGCLPTMYYNSKSLTEAVEVLKKNRLHVFSPIRRSNKVDEMTFAQEALNTFSPRSAAGVDYRTFVKELVGGANNG